MSNHSHSIHIPKTIPLRTANQTKAIIKSGQDNSSTLHIPTLSERTPRRQLTAAQSLQWCNRRSKSLVFRALAVPELMLVRELVDALVIQRNLQCIAVRDLLIMQTEE